ncbi:hypothetical protein R1sor_002875 [Riccia sorocarpa]|uniref:50S ribosomal protein L22, chloroplastic n=1 Tax=Riccia sorocarpa TaxID=122646 RepID=A0ABD3H0D4_9MARC
MHPSELQHLSLISLLLLMPLLLLTRLIQLLHLDLFPLRRSPLDTLQGHRRLIQPIPPLDLRFVRERERERVRPREPPAVPQPLRRTRHRRDEPEVRPLIEVDKIGIPIRHSRRVVQHAIKQVCNLRAADHITIEMLTAAEIYRIKQEIMARFQNGWVLSEMELGLMVTKYLRDHKNHYVDTLRQRLALLDHVSDPDVEMTIKRPVLLREESFGPLLLIARQTFWFGEIARMEEELARARSIEEVGGEPTHPSAYWERGLQIAREKNAFYGVPEEKYALAATRVRKRYANGMKITHRWGQGGEPGFRRRFLARYGREINNDEVEFARAYDEHRLYAYIDGGGTFDDVEDARSGPSSGNSGGHDGGH